MPGRAEQIAPAAAVFLRHSLLCPTPENYREKTIKIPWWSPDKYQVTRFRLPFKILVVLLSLYAFTEVSKAQHIPLKTYGRQEGLNDLNANCMIQDRTGYLWVSTEEGVYRYDGKHFRQFSQSDGLTAQIVGPLTEDDAGNLWLGTSSGLFIKRGERFEAIADSRVQGEISSCSAMIPWQDGVLLSDNGSLWLIRSLPKSSSKETPSWSVEPFSSFPSTWGEAGGVLRGRLGELWAGCGNSICHLASNHAERWTETNGVPKDSWLHFLRTSDGGLWARGKSHVIFLPAQGTRFENRTRALGSLLYRDDGASLLEDPLGRILLQYEDGIVMWRNKDWRRFGQINQKLLLRSFPVLTDRAGNLWLSVAGHGLFRCLGYGNWESWTEDEGIAQGLVYGVIRDSKDRIWIAAHAGLFMSTPPYEKFVQIAPHLRAATQLRALLETRDGGIWASGRTRNALYLDPKTLEPHVVEILDHDGYISSLQEMADGTVWMATDKGLFSVRNNGGHFLVEHLSDPVLGQNRIFQLVRDTNGDIYALISGSVLRYSSGRWSAIPLPSEAAKLRLLSLTTGQRNELWVAGENVVFRINIDGNTILHVQQYSHDQVTSDLLDFIGKERSGAIWVGGNQGAARYDGKSWRFFTTEDGLIWQDADSRAFFADPDGSVWIGTSDGLSHFRSTPAALQIPELPAPLIHAVIGKTALDENTTQVFPSNNSTLDVSLSSLTYIHESAIDFRYRLQGMETAWNSDSTGMIRYLNLPPGSYVLETYSVDEATHRQSPVRSIRFTILGRWWRQWPFVVLWCVLSLAFLALIVRAIVQYLLHRKLLEEQATKDGLTKLWNRNMGLTILRKELSRAQRLKQAILLIMADIDHFKRINDTYGHLAGDAAIREVASLLQSSLRSYDTVCRYGGEEFLLIVPQISRESALQVVESLHESIRKLTIPFDEESIFLTCSFGSLYIEAPETDTPEVFLSLADQLLYTAKRGGRDRIEFSTYYARERSAPLV